jgi:hypothetical protein
MPLIYNGVTIPENTAGALNYNGVAITQVIYNGVAVWNLVTGPSFAMFLNYQIITRINDLGALVSANIDLLNGPQRLSDEAGCGIGAVGTFYNGSMGLATVLRLNPSAIILSTVALGTYRRYLLGTGSASSIGIFWGGYILVSGVYTNLCTRINEAGSLVGSETAVGVARGAGSGVDFDLGLFYTGYAGAGALNRLARINTSGALIAAETTIGTSRYYAAGTKVDNIGLFYAGQVSGYPLSRTLTRLTSTGTLVGAETALATARWHHQAGTSGTVGIFFGGDIGTSSKVNTNLATRINSSGVQVGVDTYVGQTMSNYAAGLSL